MKKPKSLNNNDLIVISSMSNGIIDDKKQSKLINSKLLLEKLYRVEEDKYTRCSSKGESTNALERAKELERIISDKDVKAIIGVTGGNYLLEVLNYFNFDTIINNVKWIQGQSDITILLYILTTKYDIQTIYSYNANSLSAISDLEYENNISVLSGKKIIQSDYKYVIRDGLKEDSTWKSSENINVTGRIIGGCLECIMDLVGTKYDNTLEFIERYKKDGIIWYFDIDYMTNEQLLRNIWHLDELGWFKYTKCIIFGRNEENSYTGITIDEAINRGIKNKEIPYITNFDLGHTYPRITIVNGSIVRVTANNNEKNIEILE